MMGKNKPQVPKTVTQVHPLTKKDWSINRLIKPPTRKGVMRYATALLLGLMCGCNREPNFPPTAILLAGFPPAMDHPNVIERERGEGWGVPWIKLSGSKGGPLTCMVEGKAYPLKMTHPRWVFYPPCR